MAMAISAGCRRRASQAEGSWATRCAKIAIRLLVSVQISVAHANGKHEGKERSTPASNDKCRDVARALCQDKPLDIQQYQNVPYPLQPVPELQDYILTNMQSAGDVHEMYDMSLSVEPREREDEKIARYTQYFSLHHRQDD